MSKTVFITGATGYIGGQVLYELLSSSIDYKINALVRTQAKADLLVKRTNGKVNPVLGNLDDLSIIREQVNISDIVINTANVDHVPSVEILADALIAKQSETILIHTSGTSVIGDAVTEKNSASTKVYSDIYDIDEINSLPLEQPHRPVDKIVLEIEEKNPKTKVAIVCPSNIVGISNGYDNIISIQIPFLIRNSIKNKKAWSVYSGDYIWSHIHIKDLGQIYALILNGFLEKKDIPHGRNGYYFGSYGGLKDEKVTTKPSEIEHTWRLVSDRVAELLYEKKIVPTKEVAELNIDEIVQLTGDKFGPKYVGTNSRSRGDNAVKIGFKPKYSSLEDYWKRVEEDVEHVLNE